MRIIAGSARGRTIQAPKGDQTRPTLDRVRESLFGILQMKTPGSRVLDLFAGSGSLGLEALSRGAEYALFNDRDGKCCAVIRQNLQQLRFSDRAVVLQLDAMRAIERIKEDEAFDIVFLDPPYREGGLSAAEALFRSGCVAEDGILVLEHDGKEPPEGISGLMERYDLRRYGDVGLAFFRHDPGKGEV